MAKNKLKEKKGTVLLIILLVIAVLVMLAVILVPMYMQHLQDNYEIMDHDIEQTATDSAIMRFAAEGGDFTCLYDSEKKQFVEKTGQYEITPYGNTKEHKGKVLRIYMDEEGVITLSWIYQWEFA